MSAIRGPGRTLLEAGAALAPICLAIAGPAAAQTAATPSNSVGALAEVVVTASKRPERIVDVSSSVSAVGAAELTRTQTIDIQDIAARVPGLNLEQGFNPGASKLILRGQNAGGDGATVAVVVDDAPISYSLANTSGGYLSADFDTYDMNRVEVLRGPQGTLYGATSEGGLIKYVTNAPDPRAYHGGVEADVWGLDHGETAGAAKGYVNVPLLDGAAAVRVSGFYEGIPGYINDAYQDRSHFNNGYKYGVRGSLLWAPTSRLTIRFTAADQYLRQHGDNYIDVAGASNPSALFQPVAGYNHNTYTPDISQFEAQIYILNISYALGPATLQSITSYGHTHVPSLTDLPSYSDGTFSVQQVQLNDLEKPSQEIRLTSTPGSKILGRDLDWQAGVFATRERSVFNQTYDVLAVPSHAFEALFQADQLPIRYEEIAAYADLDYRVLRDFDIDVGGRLSRNHSSGQSTIDTGAPPPLQFPNYSISETSGTFSVGPRFHFTPDAMAYVRVASGYRPGGPTLPVPGLPTSLPTTFRSDSTVSYEGGLKGVFLDRAVSADVAAFYIDWSRIQVNTVYVVDGTPYQITGNAGTASSAGVEWDLHWTPLSGFTLGLLGAYTDAHLTRDAPGIGGLSGDRLAYVPDVSLTATADHEWRLTDSLRAFVGGSYTYLGRRWTDFGDRHLLPSYGAVALQGGVRRGPYSLEVYAKNLTDARGITGYFSYGAVANEGEEAIIRPRTIGMRVAADF